MWFTGCAELGGFADFKDSGQYEIGGLVSFSGDAFE